MGKRFRGGQSPSSYIERFGKTDDKLQNIEINEEDLIADVELELHETPAAKLQEMWEKYKKLSAFLPERELDMIEMSILFEKDQTSIGNIFQVSQGDVSYRIKRLKERLQYLLALPDVDHDSMRVDLVDLLGEELTDILMLLLKYTSQSKVGKMLDLSQGKIRHRYIRSLERIKEECYRNPRFIIYYDYLCKLQGNYNSLKSPSTQHERKRKFGRIVKDH